MNIIVDTNRSPHPFNQDDENNDVVNIQRFNKHFQLQNVRIQKVNETVQSGMSKLVYYGIMKKEEKSHSIVLMTPYGSDLQKEQFQKEMEATHYLGLHKIKRIVRHKLHTHLKEEAITTPLPIQIRNATYCIMEDRGKKLSDCYGELRRDPFHFFREMRKLLKTLHQVHECNVFLGDIATKNILFQKTEKYPKGRLTFIDVGGFSFLSSDQLDPVQSFKSSPKTLCYLPGAFSNAKLLIDYLKKNPSYLKSMRELFDLFAWTRVIEVVLSSRNEAYGENNSHRLLSFLSRKSRDGWKASDIATDGMKNLSEELAVKLKQFLTETKNGIEYRLNRYRSCTTGLKMRIEEKWAAFIGSFCVMHDRNKRQKQSVAVAEQEDQDWIFVEKECEHDVSTSWNLL